MFKGMKCRDKKKQTNVPLPVVSNVFSPRLLPSRSASAPYVSTSLPALEEVITGTEGGLGGSCRSPLQTLSRGPHPAVSWGEESCFGGLGLFKGKLLLIDTLDYGDLEKSIELKKNFFFFMNVV